MLPFQKKYFGKPYKGPCKIPISIRIQKRTICKMELQAFQPVVLNEFFRGSEKPNRI